MTSRTGSARRILVDFEKVRELRLGTERDGWLSVAHETLWRVLHEMGGGDEKARIERLCLPLSPYVETFNSKVIKGFEPELRSRKYFSCYEILCSMLYIYIWTLYVHFTHSCIWLWYTWTKNDHHTWLCKYSSPTFFPRGGVKASVVCERQTDCYIDP